MGWVLMSEEDVQRIEVPTEVLAGKRTVGSAAIVLAVSARQVGRLLIRLREEGGGGLVHKGRGQSSNHRVGVGVREYVLELVKTRYADFGPTLAIEMLLDKHGIKVGRETLRTWMVEAGMWLSRKQRRSFHQPRLRREFRRTGPDRRQRPPLVRGSRRALYAAGVYRRCDQSADAAALRAEREHRLILRSVWNLPR